MSSEKEFLNERNETLGISGLCFKKTCVVDFVIIERNAGNVRLRSVGDRCNLCRGECEVNGRKIGSDR